MKYLPAFFLILLCSTQSHGATSITATTVSGHWTLSGSPYVIHNNISIPSGQSLMVDPGVAITFQGPYFITVNGSLRLAGTAAAPIVFDVADTSGWYIDTASAHVGGWSGIYYETYVSGTPDTSYIAYCDFHHLKNGILYAYRNMHIEHCNFSNNFGSLVSLASPSPLGMCEINNCTFFDNYAKQGAQLRLNPSEAQFFVHDNEFYDIQVGSAGSIISCIGSTALITRNSVHHNSYDVSASWLPNEDIRMIDISSGTSPSNIVFSDNNVYENTGILSGPVNFFESVADISGNYICNNRQFSYAICAHAFGGGALYLVGSGDYGGTYAANRNSTYSVRNNVIANNHTGLYGGAISIYTAKSVITNNTIVHNKSPRGGAIDCWLGDTSTICIRNNIMYGNVSGTSTDSAITIAAFEPVNLKVDHNWMPSPYYRNVILTQVFGYPNAAIAVLSDSNTNVIGTDPGLVSPTLTANYTESAIMSDFRLSAMSPCINKGFDSAVVSGSVDFAGNNRILDTVDMGAYEFDATSISSTPTFDMDTMFRYCCNIVMRHEHPVSVLNALTSQPNMRILAYPNPATNNVFIATAKAGGILRLSSIAGEVVYEKQVTNTLTHFDLQDLPRGTYFVTWTNNGDSNTGQIVVK